MSYILMFWIIRLSKVTTNFQATWEIACKPIKIPLSMLWNISKDKVRYNIKKIESYFPSSNIFRLNSII